MRPAVRLGAIRALARIGPEAAARLGAELEHGPTVPSFVECRLLIIEILLLFGDDAAPAAVGLATALGDPSPKVKGQAVRAFARLGPRGVSAVSKLVELTAHPVAMISEPAAKGLRIVGRKLKKEGIVMWWVVPRVYWLELMTLAIFLVGWFAAGALLGPPKSRLHRAVKLATLPLLVSCPTVYYMVSRPWAEGFLPDRLPVLLPLPLVVTLSSSLLCVLVAAWAAGGRRESVLQVTVNPKIRGFHLAGLVTRSVTKGLSRALNVQVREVATPKGEALTIQVREGANPEADVRGMAPEARGEPG
jgi:hypothetical protein